MDNVKQTSAYYGNQDVYCYLVRAGYAFGASCWAADHGTSGKVDTLVAAEWFKKYFPAGEGYMNYIRMENELTAYWGW